MKAFGMAHVPRRTGDPSLRFNELEERRKWAKSLSDATVRDLASDYIRHGRDSNCDAMEKDAYDEYCRRFPEELEQPGTPHTKAKRRK